MAHTDDLQKAFAANEKKEKAQQRVDEIENTLLELPFNDPQFQQLVSERNNLLIIANGH